MYTRTKGIYTDKTTNTKSTLFIRHTKDGMSVMLTNGNTIESAYTYKGLTGRSAINNTAKNVADLVRSHLGKCTAAKSSCVPFTLGTATIHDTSTKKVQSQILRYDNKYLVGCDIHTDKVELELEYDSVTKDEQFQGLLDTLEFVELQNQGLKLDKDDTSKLIIRTLEEIALDKDITWLKGKKYYIINDDKVAEQIFSLLDQSNYGIAYDTETTGLKINIFSKVNSKEQHELREYNKGKPKAQQIRADSLVGIIFCVEDNVSYYFPVGNKKFKNLYEENTPIKQQLIEKYKAKYTLEQQYQTNQAQRGLMGDIIRYWQETPATEITPDVILMERCRNILSTKHIIAHHGSFEWKVSYCYGIDLNLCDDTMLMHQLMYKFRSTTSNRGEPSGLSALSKRELGITQLDLKDFFVGYVEDTKGLVKGGKKKADIDFSLMDYNGTLAYAPTDGDATLQIWKKYKKDLEENHKELVYLYNIEVTVACAIGYMEFYGMKLNEEKIDDVCSDKETELLDIELEFRESINYNTDEERQAREGLQRYKDEIKAIRDKETELEGQLKQAQHQHIKQGTKESQDNLDLLESKLKEHRSTKHTKQGEVQVYRESVYELISKSANTLNLRSPKQVCDLFYDELGIPYTEKSVSSKVLKTLRKQKTDDGDLKYPVVDIYSRWKETDTLITKFFGKLPQFMYINGYIFPSFGQISTATGRMSCSKPNTQQMCKEVTELVIPRGNNIMLSADYSQIEYRTLVALAEEHSLIEQFRNPDNDYHTLMASLMYGVPYSSVTKAMRSDAKKFNFGIPYGMGFNSLARLLYDNAKKESVDIAKEKYALYFKEQPNVRAYFDTNKERVSIYKYTETLWHRRRDYSFTDADGKVDSMRKGVAERQANNAIIQGTAADIFKISVARNFNYIRRYGLFGLLLIVNMVHDEQLIEINCSHLDTLTVYKQIAENMQFQVEGFPPLFIGGGFGFNWKQAKGEVSEIHPHLCDILSKEAEGRATIIERPTSAIDVQAYFQKRVDNFRQEKVANYLKDSSNKHQLLHPIIASYITSYFSFGKDKEYYQVETDEELLRCLLGNFIEEYQLGLDANDYLIGEQLPPDEEEDKVYIDDEDGDGYDDDDDIYLEDLERTYQIIEEEAELGVRLEELIKEFGYYISTKKRVCGISLAGLTKQRISKIASYIEAKSVDSGTPNSMEFVMLMNTGLLERTGIYVTDIDYKGLMGN